jgi:hypothetical protein
MTPAKYIVSYTLTDDATGDGSEVAEAQEAIARIAARILGIGTLDTRHSDALDFHELSVAGLRRALEAAYEAGRRRRVC